MPPKRSGSGVECWCGSEKRAGFLPWSLPRSGAVSLILVVARVGSVSLVLDIIGFGSVSFILDVAEFSSVSFILDASFGSIDCSRKLRLNHLVTTS